MRKIAEEAVASLPSFSDIAIRHKYLKPGLIRQKEYVPRFNGDGAM
jgi:hypothetical protein